MEEIKLIQSWEHDGINYKMFSDLSVTSDKSDIHIKQFDPTSKSFVANGKLYHIETSLSTERWIKQNMLETELGFGMSFAELSKAMKTIYTYTNENGGRMGDIGRISYDAVNGISKMLDRQPLILKFCALFINTVDEDRKSITDDQIAIKCEDFRKEGFAIDGFFVFALSLVSGLADDYKQHTQSILNVAGDLITHMETKPTEK